MRKSVFCASCLLCALLVASCSKKDGTYGIAVQSITDQQKNHAWYYFGGSGFVQAERPSAVPAALERPWTEAVRISCAATAPGSSRAYAVVNRLGMLELTESTIKLFGDNALFMDNTADSLVFSDGIPVFYLYRSTFFNQDMLFVQEGGEQPVVAEPLPARPFLAEFNPQSRTFFPLVSYANIGLTNADQVTGFFWDGKTWACSAKTMAGDTVDFSYFKWEPLVPLTDLSPALTGEFFTFLPLTAQEYRSLNTPALFGSAPQEIRRLLAGIPDSYAFYLTVTDGDGTSPRSYYHDGSSTAVNAGGATKSACGFTIVLFPDGTTYAGYERGGVAERAAFRLPLLPAGFEYGDFAVAGTTLYVAWEERAFYKTARAGFLTVDLADVLKL